MTVTEVLPAAEADGLDASDWFCGAGGSSQGADAVPGVRVRLAANHWERAIASHEANFPDAEHFQGDLHDAAIERFPRSDLFWASPECPKWSQARGKARDFARQPDLFGETLTDEATDRSRALMWDVPRYLEGIRGRGRGPVLAGVVENVIDVRDWIHWHEWRRAIASLGYRTRLIALNSMHAQPVRTQPAPQSRDRLYLAYWLDSLGRDPDWNRWLRPRAWCPGCEQEIRAVQSWKKPGTDMGRYRQQYVYRCPHVSCRNAVVEPPAVPAAWAIDWADLGTRIGDRDRPMSPKTRARIAAGLARYGRPVTLEAAGNTFERRPGVRTWPVDAPLTAQTATASKALACPPLIVPAGGTWRDAAVPGYGPFPARTTRENDGLAFPPVLDYRTWEALAAAAMIMRNNGSRGDGGEHCTPAAEPMRTLTSAGHQSLVSWAHLLVPYYGTGTARPASEPVGALPTRDRYGLATGAPEIDIEEVLFRMLKPAEIGRAMAFADTYIVLGTQREQIRQYGNAVTPPVTEVLYSALVEAITGRELMLAA